MRRLLCHPLPRSQICVEACPQEIFSKSCRRTERQQNGDVLEHRLLTFHPLLGRGGEAKKFAANSPLVTGHSSLAFELTFVLRAVEVAFRFCDETVIAYLPEFISADSNAFSSAARTGVRSGECPMKLRSV